MTSPRTKKMLLLAAATIASPAACSNEQRVTGFYGDIAYDAGYEETGSFQDPDAHAVPDVNTDAADAAADAADAADAETADADADADAADPHL